MVVQQYSGIIGNLKPSTNDVSSVQNGIFAFEIVTKSSESVLTGPHGTSGVLHLSLSFIL